MFSPDFFIRFNNNWGLILRTQNTLSKNAFSMTFALGDDFGVLEFPAAYQHGRTYTQFTAESQILPPYQYTTSFLELGWSAFF